MRSLQTVIRLGKSKLPELAANALNYAGYGEGWHLSEYRHHKMVCHTGGWPGFISRVSMVPDMKLGMGGVEQPAIRRDVPSCDPAYP